MNCRKFIGWTVTSCLDEWHFLRAKLFSCVPEFCCSHPQMPLETRAKSFCQTMSQAYKSHSNDQTLDLKSFIFEIEKFCCVVIVIYCPIPYGLREIQDYFFMMVWPKLDLNISNLNDRLVCSCLKLSLVIKKKILKMTMNFKKSQPDEAFWDFLHPKETLCTQAAFQVHLKARACFSVRSKGQICHLIWGGEVPTFLGVNVIKKKKKKERSVYPER